MRDGNLEQLQHFPDEQGNIEGFEIRVILARVDHKLTNQFGGANRDGPDCLDLPKRHRTENHFRLCEFRFSQNAAEQIVEVMSDAAGDNPEALQFLSGENLVLRPFEVRRFDTGPDDPVYVSGRIPHGNQVRVEVAAPARQVQSVIESDRRASREATAIICGHLRGEIRAEYLVDKPAGYLGVCKAHSLLLGRIEAHDPEAAIGRNIQQEHANRDVVEDLLILHFESVLRRSGFRGQRGASKEPDFFLQLADTRTELPVFLIQENRTGLGCAHKLPMGSL